MVLEMQLRSTRKGRTQAKDVGAQDLLEGGPAWLFVLVSEPGSILVFIKTGMNYPTFMLWTLIIHLPLSEGQATKMNQKSHLASGSLPSTGTDRLAGVWWLCCVMDTFMDLGKEVQRGGSSRYREDDIWAAIWRIMWYFPGGWHWVSSSLAGETSSAETLESELVWHVWEGVLWGMIGAEGLCGDTVRDGAARVFRSQITDYAF